MDPRTVHSIDRPADESHYAFHGREGCEDIYSLIALCQSVLLRRRQTIAIAEAASGGALTDLWTGGQDASRSFAGAVVAGGDRALVELLAIPEVFVQNFHGTSRDMALAMAGALWQRLSADFAVALVGVDDRRHSSPSQPVGLVWIAIRTPTREIAQRLDFSSVAAQRNLLWERACYAACKIFLQVLFEEDATEESVARAEAVGMGVRI